MKKTALLLLATTMLLSMTACGGEKKSDTYEITLSSHQTTSSPHQWVIDEFEKRVEERTAGGIEVSTFAGGQLGNARENIEGVQVGTIQMCLADTGSISNLTTEYNILQLPFIYRDYDHLNKVLESDIIAEYMDSKLIADRGVRPLGWYPDGLRDFIVTKPINSLEDFSGRKLRAMESDVVIDTINAIGAAATPIPWGEVYTSIQTNVVEGMEAAPTSIYSMKFNEVADQLVLTEHINLGVTLLIGEDFFQSLPEEYQTVITEVMNEVMAEQRTRTVDQMEQAVADLKAAGVTVTEIDKAEFAEKCQPVWDKYSSTIEDGQEIIDAILVVE